MGKPAVCQKVDNGAFVIRRCKVVKGGRMRFELRFGTVEMEDEEGWDEVSHGENAERGLSRGEMSLLLKSSRRFLG